MYAPFTTNAATVITLLVMWSAISALAMYILMAYHYRNMREDLDLMDYHLMMANDTIEDILRQAQGDENEVVRIIDKWS
jgi:hypothetical protein